MPNIKSAKKRMRQNTKRRARNRAKKTAIRTCEKKIRKLTQEKNLDKAKETLGVFYSLLDKAAKTNLIHKNTASRKKSRLTQLVKKSEPAAAAPSAPETT